MKGNLKPEIRSLSLLAVMPIVLAGLVLGPAQPVAAEGNPNPGVIPPQPDPVVQLTVSGIAPGCSG